MGNSNKYYAVRVGRETGVFNSWSEAKAATNGYSGAEFKSFADSGSANSFVNAGSSGSSGSSSSYGGSSGGSSGGYGGYGSSSSSRSSGGTTRGPSGARHYGSSSSSGGSSSGRTEIYTDGSSLGNGTSSARSGWGVYHGPGDSRNSYGQVSGAQTNNRGELTAISEALHDVKESGRGQSYTIKTDSKYAEKSVNMWADNWERNDWKTSTGGDVANRDLIEGIRGQVSDLSRSGYDVNIEHVRGHSDNHGNDQADALARRGAAGARR